MTENTHAIVQVDGMALPGLRSETQGTLVLWLGKATGTPATRVRLPRERPASICRTQCPASPAAFHQRY
jgi:hypothetical protein